MRIIISPAKKMAVNADSLRCAGPPALLDRAGELLGWIRGMSPAEQKALWKCSEAIAERSAAQFEGMDLGQACTPALLAYDGIQYTYMAPAVFEDGQVDYVQEHLRILSGFYGALRPLDGVAPYRLEMQAKGALGDSPDLYAFWGDAIYREVMRGNGDRTVLNLASKEYSRAVERHLQPGDRFVTCVFGELEGGRVAQKGVYAKMARGEMVRYLAGIGAERPEQAQGFDWSRYRFDEARSDGETYVFTRPPRRD